jgi:hypothetical protein
MVANQDLLKGYCGSLRMPINTLSVSKNNKYSTKHWQIDLHSLAQLKIISFVT